jgi:hydrogenase 3 maturation protease
VLGIGSDLRGDDAAGVLVARSLQEERVGKKLKKKLKIFIGGTAPENLTGEIKKFKPTHLIIVDAADVGFKKGAVHFISHKEVGGMSASTHKLPMKVFVDYLTHFTGCETLIIGIQPASLEFNTPPSQAVGKSVKYVSNMLAEVLFGRPQVEGKKRSCPRIDLKGG